MLPELSANEDGGAPLGLEGANRSARAGECLFVPFFFCFLKKVGLSDFRNDKAFFEIRRNVSRPRKINCRI